MPVFHLHFRSRGETRADDDGFRFASLEDAYLHVCASVGDAAQQVVLQGGDPLLCAFVIADASGRTLMDVPFSEVLSPKHWLRPAAPWRPAEAARSARVKTHLAREMFKRTLGESPIAHALVSLDAELLSLNEAGLALTNESADRVLGNRVFDTFEGYQGEMSAKLEAFYNLSARGLKSRVTNLYYRQPERAGAEANFWSQALAWPLLDDDGRVLAVVNCAVASMRPWGDGDCSVVVGHYES